MSSFEENRRRPFWIFAVLLLVAGGGYMVFGGKADEAAQAAAAGQQARPPAMVTVYDVDVADVPLVFEYSGRTNGSREVEIRARVSGILMKRSYVEGQAVKQGDVLFEIDPAPFKVALDQAKARFAQANNDWARAQKLYAVQALSARERDQARANYAQTKAEVENAQINLGYTTVTAPISGVASQEGMSEGSLVTADSSLLTRLSQLDPIYVNFSVPDSEMLSQRHLVSTGEYSLPEDGILRAEIHLGNGSVYAHEGEVNFTDSIIDPQTGSVNSRAVVPNPENVLMPGQFVRVVVKGLTKRDAITIPDKAILQSPQGPFVYVVSEQGTAEMRPVVLGMLNDNMRLIEDGLTQGDRVIVEGMIKVMPNAPVQVDGETPVTDEAQADDGQDIDAAQQLQPIDPTVDEGNALDAQDNNVQDNQVPEEATEETTEEITEDVMPEAASSQAEESATDRQYIFGLGIEEAQDADTAAELQNDLSGAQEE